MLSSFFQIIFFTPLDRLANSLFGAWPGGFSGQGSDLFAGDHPQRGAGPKKLRELPTGGRTPLAAGLDLAYTKLKGRSVKDPGMIPLIILISDGRANVSLQGGNPFMEAKKLGNRIRAEGFATLVIDTEQDVLELGLARELAAEMGARYTRLRDLRAGEITEAVRRSLQQEGDTTHR